MSTKMQLAYFVKISTDRSSYSGRMQSQLTLDVYRLLPDDTYVSDSDKLFEVEFFNSESEDETDELARKFFESHPKHWHECAKGIRFNDWHINKLTVFNDTSHLCNCIEKTGFALAAMKKIEACIAEYNLCEKFDRRDIVSTWFAALLKLRFEQLQHSKQSYRPVRNVNQRRQGHYNYLDRVD